MLNTYLLTYKAKTHKMHKNRKDYYSREDIICVWSNMLMVSNLRLYTGSWNFSFPRTLSYWNNSIPESSTLLLLPGTKVRRN